MPITTFSSFTDGLEANQRSRQHFVANLDIDDDRRWIPYADGVLGRRAALERELLGASRLQAVGQDARVVDHEDGLLAALHGLHRHEPDNAEERDSYNFV